MKKVILSLIVLWAGFAKADPKAFHGMVLVGTKEVFASHLPMYHPPHDYQAVFKIELDAETMADYLSDKAKSSPETIYTLAPEPFVLPVQAQNPKTLKATLFHGHFEKGGVPIAHGVSVSFVKTLLFKKIKKNWTLHFPESPNYQGVVFGNASEMFLVHAIGSAPNFDQIVAIKPNLALISGGEFSFPGQENKPLQAPSTLSIPHFTSPVEVIQTIYLEIDELKE